MPFSDRYAMNPSDPKDWSPTVQPGAYSGPSGRDTGGIEFYEGPSPARSGFRRRIGTADDGNPIYRNLTAEERKIPEFSLASEREEREDMRTRLAEERARKIHEEQRRLDRQQWNDQFRLLQAREAGNSSYQQGQLRNQEEQIRLQGEDSRRRNTYLRDTLQADVSSRDKDRIQRGEEYRTGQATLNRQLELNNLLQNRKMDIEEKQYGLTMRAYDRAGKIQALTSAADLLARAF